MQKTFILSLLMLCISSCSKPAIHPTRGEIIEAVYGLGTVTSEQVFQAKAAIITTVSEFYVTEGQNVKRGDRLYRTDQGQVAVAPFAGRVTDIMVSVQENLFPQTLILTVINLERLYLEVSLEQQGAMRIKKGLAAEVSFEFFRNRKLTGEVMTIFPSSNQFTAKVNLKNWPEGVLPGMTADVAFEIARKSDAQLIPARALSNGSIQFKRDGKRQKVRVKVGLSDAEKVEILEPELLSTDELIVL